MSESIQHRRVSPQIKEKGQYLVAFGLVAVVLWIVDLPLFVILFFGLFAYFASRVMTSRPQNGTRDIFEFYLAAHEIVCDEDRRWYGFEIRDVIARGEKLSQELAQVPPLVQFSLGALYAKAGDHRRAVDALLPLKNSDAPSEEQIMEPSPELRHYVRILRRIESEAEDAPRTSKAIKDLEHLRRTRLDDMLAENAELRDRAMIAEAANDNDRAKAISDGREFSDVIDLTKQPDETSSGSVPLPVLVADITDVKRGHAEDPFGNRKPISEVLQDIYDKKVQ